MTTNPDRYVLRHKPTQLYVQVWGWTLKLGSEIGLAPMFTTDNLHHNWHRLTHRAAVRKWPTELEKVPVVDPAGTGIPQLP